MLDITQTNLGQNLFLTLVLFLLSNKTKGSLHKSARPVRLEKNYIAFPGANQNGNNES